MKASLTKKICIYLGALVLATVIAVPVLWLFIMSISSSTHLTTLPLQWWPDAPTFENYRNLLVFAENSPSASFLYGIRNSIIIAFAATGLSIIAAIPAAYSFSRLPGPRRKNLLYAVIAIFMLPPVAIVLPLYTVMSALGLLNTHFALIIVYCSILLPFTTWLLKSNFDTIPGDLDEAPIIDGANRLQAIWYVILPIARPALGAAVMMAVLLAWDEFFYGLLFTNDIRAKTITVAIADLAAGRVADYGLISAAGILAAVPPVILAFFMQKTLVSGLASGSVKG
ncbi:MULTISPECIES: carbohydrate ABC transporter permease [Thalassospira]|uniref:Maltose/maltodextrin transport system permease protein MalG n=1 Tax=Thalassospira povalilytica TaxID=732237 RepID=A0A8I1SK63_9PROT|nr:MULTISPECIES: carbohydrate ABC transporter permease [Thalassospira]MEE3044994.1 carbohydrate ABC transporter permease [Pseudomonadota bacterium]RCK19521.1 sugar ABC transporter permease [Thalassospira profundimaris]KZB66023.1 sugar ABC transporter permease [Thalassospira sp. MCCC 1A02491]MAL40402.1 carbohydrate ABC transporter permease [Thalassospira sp.]MBN8197693.1 carbohydrate ABC transporter permease [Thalassospira povalilytica]